MALPSRASSDAAPLLLLETGEEWKEEIPQRSRFRGFFVRFHNIFASISTSFLAPVLLALKPSFLHKEASPKPHRATIWLDGVRGVAAFIVFIYHFQRMFHDAYPLGYGSNNGDNDHWLIQLPIIRIVPNGQVQVAIFYVLSGCSLSLRPLQLARIRDWDTFFTSMHSSVFRRAIRLYLPVYAVQTGVLVLTLLGAFKHGFSVAQNWHYIGQDEAMQQLFDSPLQQIADWTWTMWVFANPFETIYPSYDVHLWTIPIEFRNSIIIFATLVAFAKLRNRIRAVLMCLLWVFCMCVNNSETALFFAGMIIAEYMVVQDERAEQRAEKAGLQTKSKWRRIRDNVFWGTLWAILCFTGLFLLSWPGRNVYNTAIYGFLERNTPRIFNNAEYTYQRTGAFMFCFALAGSATLRRPFRSALAIYLGRISFMLYILHGPLIHMIGIWFVEVGWKITGSEKFWAYEGGWFLGFVAQTVVLVYVADVVTRVVDEPIVRFGRTLQKTWSIRDPST